LESKCGTTITDYLELNKSFIIIVNGRIVMENYFNNHTATTNWYWASAGKHNKHHHRIAEQEGLINTQCKSSNYIGTGWTSETLTQENLITCKNLLSMTSGIEDITNGMLSPNLIKKC
jgi:hypothetical protein